MTAIGQIERMVADVGQLHFDGLDHPKFCGNGIVGRATQGLLDEPDIFQPRFPGSLYHIIRRFKVVFGTGGSMPVAEPAHVLEGAVAGDFIRKHSNFVIW